MHTACPRPLEALYHDYDRATRGLDAEELLLVESNTAIDNSHPKYAELQQARQIWQSIKDSAHDQAAAHHPRNLALQTS